MALKLFHTPLTRSIRVLWTLEELGLPYELVHQPMDRKFFKTPEWRKVNPVGKLPVLFDGDERLIETFGKWREKPLQEALEGLMGEVRRFAGDAVQNDDITMLLLRYDGAAAADA